jgi:ubiquinone/menaquinone biosynthesis C-methylase UbiE
MDMNGIRHHWQRWAAQYGTGLRATTKTSTAKALELDALSRALTEVENSRGHALRILEVGCGNGQNCFALLDRHPGCSILGVDFVEQMVAAADSVKEQKRIPDDRLRFQVGNVLELSLPPDSFDVVFTDRCLINLNTDALQQQAIRALARLVKPGGQLLMIENSQQTYRLQNQLRELVGLPSRTPAEFNHFVDESTLLPFLPSAHLELFEIEDFITFHDLVLYVLVPMMNGGKVDYEHPFVDAATRLNLAMSSQRRSSAGAYGQNRLYKCRKTND